MKHMDEKITTEELVLMARENNNEAIEELITRHKTMLEQKSYKAKFFFDSKEDAIGFMMLEFWKAIKTYKSEKGMTFSTYLYMCADQSLMKVYAKHNSLKRKGALDNLDKITSDEEEGIKEKTLMDGVSDQWVTNDPFERVENKMMCNQIVSAFLDKASKREKAVFVKMYIDGKDSKSVAKEMRVEVSNVYKIKKRMNERLKKIAEEIGMVS